MPHLEYHPNIAPPPLSPPPIPNHNFLSNSSKRLSTSQKMECLETIVLIGFYCCLPCCLFYSHKSRQRRRGRRGHGRSNRGPRQNPNPITSNLLPRRSLSLPLPDDDNDNYDNATQAATQASDQSGSPIFKLPVELREMIWKEFVGGGKVHLYLTHDDHMKSYACPAARKQGEPFHNCECRPIVPKKPTQKLKKPSKIAGPAALLMSCRAM